MIDISLLEAFAAFARYGTLLEASEHLHISQPALSRSMQRLEQEAGVKLFDRNRNRISVNDCGKLLLKYAEEILEKEKEMLEAVRLFSGTATLNVGSIAPGPAYELVYLFEARRPVQYTVEENEEVLISGLHKGSFDLITLHHPLEEAGFFSEKFITEQLYALVLPAHPAANYSSISFEEMNGQTFLMLSEVGYWGELVRDRMPSSRFIIQKDMTDLNELIGSSALPAFASNITLEMGIRDLNGRVAVPFSDPESRIDFYIAGKRDIIDEISELMYTKSEKGKELRR